MTNSLIRAAENRREVLTDDPIGSRIQRAYNKGIDVAIEEIKKYEQSKQVDFTEALKLLWFFLPEHEPAPHSSKATDKERNKRWHAACKLYQDNVQILHPDAKPSDAAIEWVISKPPLTPSLAEVPMEEVRPDLEAVLLCWCAGSEDSAADGVTYLADYLSSAGIKMVRG